MASSASLVLLESRLKNTRLTRSSQRPLRSSASIVLVKVGAAAEPVMAVISALCSAIALSKAGGKCSGLMQSNGGKPNGVVQVSNNGLSVIREPRRARMVGTSPCLAPAFGTAERRGFPGCPLFGFVLVEHCFRGGVALGAELGTVAAASLIRR